MINFATRLVTRAIVLTAFVTAPPVVSALAAGDGGGGEDLMRPSGSRSSTSAPGSKAARTTHGAKKTPPSKQSLFDHPAFAKDYKDYREAYSTIYDHQDYAGAIEQLKARGHEDFANVAI
jgi:hypothetical protein